MANKLLRFGLLEKSELFSESEPVEKHGELHSIKDDNIKVSHLDLENLAYMGTNVVSGTATAVVISTGSDTCLGTIAELIVEKREVTSFDKGVNSVSWFLIRFMTCMVPVVFVICPMLCGGAYGASVVDNVLFMSLFNAGWFVESLWSQTLVIPYTGLGIFMKMSPMPPVYFLWLGGIIVVYMVLVNIIKKLYVRKYGELL